MVPFETLGVVSYSPSIVTMAVSVAVCEIFSVKEWCDLENGVRVRSRSLEIAPFDRSHTSSYSPSIVTMAISSFARYSDLLVENRDIFLPHLYLAPRRGWPRRNFVKMFNAGKTRMIWLPYGKKKLWRYVKPFSSDTGTLRTDGLTDRPTDLVYQYRASVCYAR